METTDLKWHQKPWVIYLLSFVVFPVGVVLLWKSKVIKLIPKLAVTLVAAFILLGVIGSFLPDKYLGNSNGSGGRSNNKSETSDIVGKWVFEKKSDDWFKITKEGSTYKFESSDPEFQNGTVKRVEHDGVISVTLISSKDANQYQVYTYDKQNDQLFSNLGQLGENGRIIYNRD